MAASLRKPWLKRFILQQTSSLSGLVQFKEIEVSPKETADGTACVVISDGFHMVYAKLTTQCVQNIASSIGKHNPFSILRGALVELPQQDVSIYLNQKKRLEICISEATVISSDGASTFGQPVLLHSDPDVLRLVASLQITTTDPSQGDGIAQMASHYEEEDLLAELTRPLIDAEFQILEEEMTTLLRLSHWPTSNPKNHSASQVGELQLTPLPARSDAPAPLDTSIRQNNNVSISNHPPDLETQSQQPLTQLPSTLASQAPIQPKNHTSAPALLPIPFAVKGTAKSAQCSSPNEQRKATLSSELLPLTQAPASGEQQPESQTIPPPSATPQPGPQFNTTNGTRVFSNANARNSVFSDQLPLDLVSLSDKSEVDSDAIATPEAAQRTRRKYRSDSSPNQKVITTHSHPSPNISDSSPSKPLSRTQPPLSRASLLPPDDSASVASPEPSQSGIAHQGSTVNRDEQQSTLESHSQNPGSNPVVHSSPAPSSYSSPGAQPPSRETEQHQRIALSSQEQEPHPQSASPQLPLKRKRIARLPLPPTLHLESEEDLLQKFDTELLEEAWKKKTKQKSEKKAEDKKARTEESSDEKEEGKEESERGDEDGEEERDNDDESIEQIILSDDEEPADSSIAAHTAGNGGGRKDAATDSPEISQKVPRIISSYFSPTNPRAKPPNVDFKSFIFPPKKS